MHARGFTLIELLVVIAIIGLLSSVVLGAVSTARSKAQYATAKQTLIQIEKAIQIAEGESGKTLMQIDGSGCSDCNTCRLGNDERNATDGCYTAWLGDITNIQTNANGLVSGLSGIQRDPWGSPYTIDENENENVGNPCVHDSLRTVGADGKWGTSDDYIVSLPFSGNTNGC